MALELGNGQNGETTIWTEKQDLTNDDSLEPHLTFYGSDPRLQVTTPPFQPPPTAEQLDHIYQPETLPQTRSLPSRGDTYVETFVLLLSWEDEDPQLPIRLEIDHLHDVFQRLYHFKVERWRIPSKDPHLRLNEKILSLVKLGDDREDCLKIVYYAGHGRLSTNRRSIWTDHHGRTVVWAGIQNALEQAKSDALILIDSCCSGTANTDEGVGVTELVAAGGFNTTANGVGAWSFTHALAAELRLLSNGHPFTIAKLYNRIVSRMQNQLPDGEEYQDPFEILPTERFVTPVHVVLTEDKVSTTRRIQLHRNHHSFVKLPQPPEENLLGEKLDQAQMRSSRYPTPQATLSISKHDSKEIELAVSRPSSTSSCFTSGAKDVPNFTQKAENISHNFILSARARLLESEEKLEQLVDLSSSPYIQKRRPMKILDPTVMGTYDEFIHLHQQMQIQMRRHNDVLRRTGDRIAFASAYEKQTMRSQRLKYERDVESNGSITYPVDLDCIGFRDCWRRLWIELLVEKLLDRLLIKNYPQRRRHSVENPLFEDYDEIPNFSKRVDSIVSTIVWVLTIFLVILTTYFIWHIANTRSNHQNIIWDRGV